LSKRSVWIKPGVVLVATQRPRDRDLSCPY